MKAITRQKLSASLRKIDIPGGIQFTRCSGYSLDENGVALYSIYVPRSNPFWKDPEKSNTLMYDTNKKLKELDIDTKLETEHGRFHLYCYISNPER